MMASKAQEEAIRDARSAVGEEDRCLDEYDALAIDLPLQVSRLLSDLRIEPSKTSTCTFVPQAPLQLLLCAAGAVPSSSALPSSGDVLATLSDLLLVPHLSLPVAVRFRPLLVDLAARWLPVSDLEKSTWDDGVTLRKFVVLAKLVEAYEEVFPILHRLISYPSLAGGPLASPVVHTLPVPDLHATLLSYLRLLSCDPTLPSHLPTPWASSHLYELFSSHRDPGVRLLAIRVAAIQTGKGEAERNRLERRWIGEAGMPGEGVECCIEGDEELVESDGGEAVLVRRVRIDGWLLPVTELDRVRKIWASFSLREVSWLAGRKAGSADEHGEMDVDGSQVSSVLPIAPSDLCSHVVNVAGVLLLRSSPSSTPSAHVGFVETPGTISILRQLALHVSQRLPVLLTGTPGSGKSSAITYLSSLLRPALSSNGKPAPPSILTLHLGDQSGVDAKSLLGSYVSSPTHPGMFEWAEGALTRAVRLGMWVVLEDVDKAGAEVLSVIGQLVEALGPTKRIGQEPTLDVPGRAKVRAGSGFMIFGTRSSLPRQGSSPHRPSFPPPVFLGHEHWKLVAVPSPTESDVFDILSRLFPRLASTEDDGLRCLVDVWKAVATAAVETGMVNRGTSARLIGMRDLIKWCRRVNSLLPPTNAAALNLFANPILQEEIFIEACDVFLGSLSSGIAVGAAPEAKLADSAEWSTSVVGTLAEGLGLSRERAEWGLNMRTPEVVQERGSRAASDVVRIGRASLATAAQGGQSRASSSLAPNFAMTRPSAILLERLAVCAHLSEPVLMVGETGTGKTTAVQQLAHLARRNLIALNLSQQTESSDLLGAFRPLDAKVPATALHNEWVTLFGKTFDVTTNSRPLDFERKAYANGDWAKLAKAWRKTVPTALEKVRKRSGAKGGLSALASGAVDGEVLAAPSPKKKRRVHHTDLDSLWTDFDSRARDFEVQHAGKRPTLVFSFVEGPLVRALRRGDWVLLDELNLAAPETLDCLSGLLQSPDASVVLTERGDLEPIPRHPDFRLFACMNPATDVGKKDLPVGLRSRFTELFVPSPDRDRDALTSIVERYIGQQAAGDRAVVLDVAEFYVAARHLAQTHQLADGSNQRPHYSMRTLARALTFAADVAPTYGLRRALWEGLLMTFTMLLNDQSASVVRGLAEKHIMAGAKNPRQALSFVPPAPAGATQSSHIQIGPFWLETGPLPLDSVDEYVLTASVQNKLVDLSRAILTRRFPVLIQGPTSAGKTSAVEYLARRTGHRFVRVNNHEHTDIQEYLGSYATDPDSGKLVFQEGLLVRALKEGHWIVLDELNLAPTDVLEALNRLLDDNRELIVPETQEVVRPHPHFMLFATQNPPGLYAGRKVLSRAFRNRFLEVHVDDVPQAELEIILCQRCKIAPSYAAKIVAVFAELQRRRQSNRVFETKHSFATLRDLFRWAGREAVGYQQLAENGYMLLAERARRPDDKATVKEVIEQMMKVRIDEASLYSVSHMDEATQRDRLGVSLPASAEEGVVWTSAMQRLYVLVATALRCDEPVLLVGETGSGKTSVCELLARAFGRELHTVNLHQNTDTADLLGGQRPVRNKAALQAALRTQAVEYLSQVDAEDPSLALEASLDELADGLEKLARRWDELVSAPSTVSKTDVIDLARRIKQSMALFDWHDGPLVQAMRTGQFLLLDEISLADDSVLERLNSVLEPGRSLVLAERSSRFEEHTHVTAVPGFQVFATMNPGGDYGKKELSPALRNRFTEIWVPHVDNRVDLLQIVETKLKTPELQRYASLVLDFSEWFAAEVGGKEQAGVGLRDLLAWVFFINASAAQVGASQAFVDGALMTIVDSIGSRPVTASMSPAHRTALRQRCHEQIVRLVHPESVDLGSATRTQIVRSSNSFAIGPFEIPTGHHASPDTPFSLQAPTTADNALRVLRALQVPKAILLEGSPGAGKTSLISALANATGHRLCRINLSDQTDLTDLFGADLPVEGGKAGEFGWKDAAFLSAMREGDWVLLDELNLASQAVLEGLNSCLDHRGTVFVPELGRSFPKHSEFRVFAAQNPHNQGGGRKGLPKSFLDRFTKVFVQELLPQDVFIIASHLYPAFPHDTLRKMITFNTRLFEETMMKRSFGQLGSPWEFNLRDLMRFLELLSAEGDLSAVRTPSEYVGTIYFNRFRTVEDRARAMDVFEEVFGPGTLANRSKPWPSLTPGYAQFGHALLARQQKHDSPLQGQTTLLQNHLAPLEAVCDCLKLSWLVILTGRSGTGKTSLVRHLAKLRGCPLEEFCMNSGVDTMELLGSFEQAGQWSSLGSVIERLSALVERLVSSLWHSDAREAASRLHAVQGDLCRTGKALVSGPKVLGFRQALEVVNASIEQVSAVAGDVQDDLAPIMAHLRSLAETPMEGGGRFEWKEGPLVRAMKEGSWLLIDHANLCNASVLDRLNSLFEPNGVITLTERSIIDGEVPVIKPHPDFRLFMLCDPQHGELSRAMRNRGVEISLNSPISGSVDTGRLSWLARGSALSSRSLTGQLSRRGAGPLSMKFASREVIASAAWSSLTDDSALLWLLQSASPLLGAPCCEHDELGMENRGRAALLHFVQSMPLKARSAACRLLIYLGNAISGPQGSQTSAVVKLLPTQGVVERLDKSMALVSACRKVEPSFFSLQPCDPFVNPYTVERSSGSSEVFDEEVTPGQLGLVQSLQLVVEAVQSQSALRAAIAVAASKPLPTLSTLERSLLINSGRLPSDSATSGVEKVAPLIISIREAVVMICNSTVNAHAGLTGLHSLSQLLRYASFLEEASTFAQFNFSLVQVVLSWILEAINAVNSDEMGWKQALDGLHAQAIALKGRVALSTGHAMQEIWSTFLPSHDDTSTLAMAARLTRLTASASRQDLSPGETIEGILLYWAGKALTNDASADLLKTLVDTCSTLMLSTPDWSPVQRRELLEIAERTEKAVLNISNSPPKDSRPRTLGEDLESVLLLEGELMALVTSRRETFEQRQALLNAVMASPCYPLDAAVVLKQDLWRLEVGELLPNRSSHIGAILSWMERIWRWMDGPVFDFAVGPECLLRPAALRVLATECGDLSNTSLRTLADHHGSVKRLATIRTLVSFTGKWSFEKGFLRLLLSSVEVFLASMDAVLPSRLLQLSHDAIKRSTMGDVVDGKSLVLQDEELAALSPTDCYKAELILEALREAITPSQSQTVDLFQLGNAFSKVALLMLRLYLPNVPLDPAVAHHGRRDFLQRQLSMLTTERQIRVAAERNITGSTSNLKVRLLDGEINAVRAEMQQLKSIPTSRSSDLSALVAMYQEIHSFMEQFYQERQLLDLQAALSHGDQQAPQREAGLQTSTSNFLRRLDKVYGERFSDILKPFVLTLGLCRLGLRFAWQGALQKHVSPKAASCIVLVEHLTCFPTSRAADRLACLDVSKVNRLASALPPASLLLLSLYASAYGADLGIAPQASLRHISVAFDQLFNLWMLDREREERARVEAQSLYKVRHEETNLDEEAEAEAEFRRMFPEYDDVMGGDNLRSSGSERTPASQRGHLQRDDILQTYRTYDRLFGSEGQTFSARDAFRNARRHTLKGVITGIYEHSPAGLDFDSAAFQFALLGDQLNNFQTVPSEYDFYRQPNIQEARKALAILNGLHARLAALISEWPEQMILHHLRERVDAILNIKLHSPLPRLLSALEQLLLHSEDWEGYASSETTLALHRQQISDLIVGWRRLELASWPQLLSAESRAVAEDVAEWWFRLYEAVVQGTRAAAQSTDDNNGALASHVRSLVSVLDQFVRSSPLGQFKARVDLLRSFSVHISQLICNATGADVAGLKEAATVCMNVQAFYSQHVGRVDMIIREQRESVEKEVREVVQLASWKDINVHALKASAQKSHRQLYKSIRKLRDILRQPTDPIMASMASDGEPRPFPEPTQITGTGVYLQDLDPRYFETTAQSQAEGPNEGPKHLSDLARTYAVLSVLVRDKIVPSVLAHQAERMDDLVEEVVATARDLATQTPAVANEDNAKRIKELTRRKTAAWQRFRAVVQKEMGFTSSVKAKVMSQHTDSAFVYGQPYPDNTPSTGSSAAVFLQRANEYHFRLLASLPKMRHALLSPHPDLPLSELRKDANSVESAMSMAFGERARIANLLWHVGKLQAMERRMQVLASAGSLLSVEGSQEKISSLETILHQLVDALAEVSTETALYASMLPIPLPEVEGLTRTVADLRSQAVECARWMKDIQCAVSIFAKLTSSESQQLLRAADLVIKTASISQKWAVEAPPLSHLFVPIAEWFSDCLVTAHDIQALASGSQGTVSGNEDGLSRQVDRTINVILVSSQKALAVGETDEDEQAIAIADRMRLRKIQGALQPDQIINELEDLAALTTSTDIGSVSLGLRRLSPFLSAYVAVAQAHVTASAHWYKCLLKLIYVLCSMVTRLTEQGFCKPPDADDGSGHGDDSGPAEALEDGTGVGEGEGMEDVSNQIEDESQMEGVRGEQEQEETKGETEANKNAVEMSNDFDAQAEDTMDQSGDEEDEQEEDPEERMDNVDPLDPNAVDEKLWGDETKSGSEDKDDQIDQDRSSNKQDKSDMVAKEDDTQTPPQKDRSSPAPPEEQERSADAEDAEAKQHDGPNAEEEQGEDAPQDDANQDEDDQGQTDAEGSRLDSQIPDAETLDLPDQMDLGEEEEEQGDEAEGPESDIDGENDSAKGAEDSEVQPQDAEPVPEEGTPASPSGLAEETGDDQDEPADEDGDKDMDAGGKDLGPADVGMNDGVQQLNGQAAEDAPMEEDVEDQAPRDAPEESSAENDRSAIDSHGRPTQAANGPQDASQEMGSADLSQPAASRPPQPSGGDDSEAAPEPNPAAAGDDAGQQRNPLRSLGDALKDFRRDVDSIAEADDADEAERPIDRSPLDVAEPPALQHVSEENDEDMQALGAADDAEGQASLENMVIEDGAPMQEAEHRLKEEQLEQQLKEWKLTDIDGRAASADELWRQYDALTHDLAFRLCEQLRLILEPTLATRLKGDYRTGKRLNMKKIIPFIASDFTKDKIWLRRTRPSQREYQVLVAMDDSKSMAESHSIHLAYQTLALVSKALNRLEVGDVSICRFGETVDVLHDFDAGPLTDDAGARIIEQLRFDQRGTNVLHLVESSLEHLQRAREKRAGSASGSKASDLWQLEVIISDGVCQEHDKLRALLRRAAEQRVMIVFVIVDALADGSKPSSSAAVTAPATTKPPRNSILSMSSVSYRTNPIDGRMELQMDRYLDTFPFEYYVVVSQIEALPDVLSATLRQWAAKVAEDQ